MNIFLLFLYILVILFAFYNKKSKAVFGITFIMAWVLISGNYDNADYSNYYWRYTYGHDILIDPGYTFLNTFFYKLGLDYRQFKTIVSFICLLLIFRTIKIFSRDFSFCSALFLIFPLIIDVTQFRNFIAYSIVYAALPLLFHDTRKSLYEYVALIFVASSIHASSFFYMIFILTRFKINMWHLIVGLVLSFVMHDYIINTFTEEFETEKLEYENHVSIMGMIFLSLQVILNVGLVWYVHHLQKTGIKSNDIVAKFSSSNVLIYANFLTFLLIPFLFDNGNYARLFRNLTLINTIYICNADYIKKDFRYFLIGLYVFYFAYINYFAGSYYELVFEPIFTYNDLFISF